MSNDGDATIRYSFDGWGHLDAAFQLNPVGAAFFDKSDGRVDSCALLELTLLQPVRNELAYHVRWTFRKSQAVNQPGRKPS